jgi:integrase
VLPVFGDARLADISRVDLQEFADRLVGQGHDPSTVHSALMPLRAIYHRTLARGQVALNPTTGLSLPTVRGKRDRIASPKEAAKLIEALPAQDQALWATAIYAGLRRGELMALRWKDVDLGEGLIRDERAWDPKAGVIEPKSAAGGRCPSLPSYAATS